MSVDASSSARSSPRMISVDGEDKTQKTSLESKHTQSFTRRAFVDMQAIMWFASSEWSIKEAETGRLARVLAKWNVKPALCDAYRRNSALLPVRPNVHDRYKDFSGVGFALKEMRDLLVFYPENYLSPLHALVFRLAIRDFVHVLYAMKWTHHPAKSPRALFRTIVSDNMESLLYPTEKGTLDISDHVPLDPRVYLGLIDALHHELTVVAPQWQSEDMECSHRQGAAPNRRAHG